MRNQTSQPDVEYCESEERLGQKDHCMLIHKVGRAEAKRAEKGKPGADYAMSRLDTELKKMLTTFRGPQQEQSERKKIRRHDNMQRWHRWSITYFSGVPVCDVLDATKRKKTHISPVLLKLHSGHWGSWQMD